MKFNQFLIKKIFKYLLFIFIIFSFKFSFAETLDVKGLYKGERHSNPVTVKKYIDKIKQTGSCPETQTFLGGKKQVGYYVTQNNNGLHIWWMEKATLFAGMVINSDGSFEGKYNKNTIKGRFDEQIFYAEAIWKSNPDTMYLVGCLAENDIIYKNEINDLKVEIEKLQAGDSDKIKNLEVVIKNKEKEIENLKNEHQKLVDGILIDYDLLEESYNDLEIKNKSLDEKIKQLEKLLAAHPWININNLHLSDSVKKGAILWSGPSKKGTTKLMDLFEGNRIVELRRVRNDDRWTLVANDRGRLGYIETAYIISQTTINSPSEQPIVEIPTDEEIQIDDPIGVTKGGIIEVPAKGSLTIKGKFDAEKIQNVKSIKINKSDAKFKGNRFVKIISIDAGLNKINIKITTSEGDQYDYNFTIKAPD